MAEYFIKVSLDVRYVFNPNSGVVSSFLTPPHWSFLTILSPARERCFGHPIFLRMKLIFPFKGHLCLVRTVGRIGRNELVVSATITDYATERNTEIDEVFDQPIL